MNPNYMDIVRSAQNSMSAGNAQTAIADFERAIKLDESEPLAYVGLAEILSNQGQLEEAVGVAREAVRRRHHFGRAQWTLATCLFRFAGSCDSIDAKSESMDEALESYDKAAALNASIEPIPVLDDWRKITNEKQAEAQRIRNQEDRVRRWDDTRSRHRLAAVTFGDTSDATKALLDEEALTDNGKRWRFEYYHAKRKY